MVPVLQACDPKGRLAVITLMFSAQCKELGIHHSADLQNPGSATTENVYPRIAVILTRVFCLLVSIDCKCKEFTSSI